MFGPESISARAIQYRFVNDFVYGGLVAGLELHWLLPYVAEQYFLGG